MEKKKLLKKMKDASPELDCDHIISILTKANKINAADGNPNKNLIVVMEELSELIQQVSKVYRGKTDTLHLEEETADVMISLCHIFLLTDIDMKNVYKIINIKVDRLENELKENGYCK